MKVTSRAGVERAADQGGLSRGFRPREEPGNDGDRGVRARANPRRQEDRRPGTAAEKRSPLPRATGIHICVGCRGPPCNRCDVEHRQRSVAILSVSARPVASNARARNAPVREHPGPSTATPDSSRFDDRFIIASCKREHLRVPENLRVRAERTM